MLQALPTLPVEAAVVVAAVAAAVAVAAAAEAAAQTDVSPKTDIYILNIYAGALSPAFIVCE